jgi:hypothetical protein
MPSSASLALYAGISALVEFIQHYGWHMVGAAVLLYYARGYASEAWAQRQQRNALAAANVPERVAVLETERRRVREEQQRAHLAAVEAAERARREKAAAVAARHSSDDEDGGSGRPSGRRAGGYNPLAPQPMTHARIASNMRGQGRRR